MPVGIRRDRAGGSLEKAGALPPRGSTRARAIATAVASLEAERTLVGLLGQAHRPPRRYPNGWFLAPKTHGSWQRLVIEVLAARRPSARHGANHARLVPFGCPTRRRQA